ncbi:MAG: Type-1 restriction enzyme MjaXIP specificity protein [Candidatus Methanogaster sp.]|nr:MAG: Type-1 restriction enzyme MjaXIP specificity protein [ANME-2 cluster archaeon]
MNPKQELLKTEIGKIPEDWSLSILKNICVQYRGVQTGPFGSQLHQRDYKPTGTPIITVEHLGENRIIHRNLPRVSDEDRERLTRYTLCVGDIVFSRVGSVDRRALVRKDEDGWLFSGRCLRVRPNPTLVDPCFLSWFFGLPAFKEHIRQIAVGATMPSLNTKLLSNAEVIHPPLPEQRAIASILGALDDKIELNRQMNATLEQIGQAIFKHWFVDFEFPNEDGTPYRSSGGEMVDSELGEVPEGWEVGCLGDIAENPRRAVKPSEISTNTAYIGLEHMPRKSITLGEWGCAGDVTSGKFQFQSEELLFGKLRPYFHKVGIAATDGVCSTDILVIVPTHPSWFGFVLGHMYSDELIQYADTISTGTKMPRANWKDLAQYEIIVPIVNVAEAFNIKINLITGIIVSNIHQSRVLAAIRDVLLPKLMSGELRVPATRKLPEVIE